jgi:hypothetical protein
VSNFDEDLANLDDWLRRLKVEYDIFFNGHRKKPPDDLRMRLEKLVKMLAESSGMSFAQRFRYNTLIGRYYVFRDRWRRTLAEKEASLEAKEQSKKEGGKKAATQKETVEKEIRISIADPKADQEEVRRLYESLTKLKGDRPDASPLMPFSQFAEYISGQTQRIKQKFGCTRVQFTLAVEGDSIKFKAKPQQKE